MDIKEIALRKYLLDENELTSDELNETVIEQFKYDNDVYEVDSLDTEFYVLTDDEADEKAKEYILDSVWAFNKDFLSCHTGVDSEIFELLQDKCESANEPIKAMIKDEDEFVADAIGSDGRGHFISRYDGQEHEVSFNNETFYIYKI